MILSGICFAIINFFVKILGAGPNQDLVDGIQHYPGHELVLARSIVSFVISYSILKSRKLPIWGNNKKWLLIRGVSGTIALTIFFYTIQNLPLVYACRTCHDQCQTFDVAVPAWIEQNHLAWTLPRQPYESGLRAVDI